MGRRCYQKKSADKCPAVEAIFYTYDSCRGGVGEKKQKLVSCLYLGAPPSSATSGTVSSSGSRVDSSHRLYDETSTPALVQESHTATMIRKVL